MTQKIGKALITKQLLARTFLKCSRLRLAQILGTKRMRLNVVSVGRSWVSHRKLVIVSPRNYRPSIGRLLRRILRSLTARSGRKIRKNTFQQSGNTAHDTKVGVVSGGSSFKNAERPTFTCSSLAAQKPRKIASAVGGAVDHAMTPSMPLKRHIETLDVPPGTLPCTRPKTRRPLKSRLAAGGVGSTVTEFVASVGVRILGLYLSSSVIDWRVSLAASPKVKSALVQIRIFPSF